MTILKKSEFQAVVLQLVQMEIVLLKPPDLQEYVPARHVAFCHFHILRMTKSI